MIKKITILFFSFILAALSMKGQDALFSQIINNRILLNPAMMAVQNSAFDLDLNYREQGIAVSSGLPLRTFQVTANFSQQSFEVDRISYGVSLLSDTGGAGHIGSNYAHLHLAYLKKLTGRYSKIGEHYLGFGTSLGAGQRTVGWERFWFGNQFNREFNFIDTNADPREEDILNNAKGQTGILPDLNAGINWYANLSDKLSLQAGFSIYHLSRPDISFLSGSSVRQPLRYNVHFNLSTEIMDYVSIVPQAVLIRQGRSQQVLLGSEIEINNSDQNEFVMRLGALSRIVSDYEGQSFESLILMFNASYEAFKFGFSYDVTVSSLSAFNNGSGAWEFRLGYSMGPRKKSGFRSEVSDFKL